MQAEQHPPDALVTCVRAEGGVASAITEASIGKQRFEAAGVDPNAGGRRPIAVGEDGVAHETPVAQPSQSGEVAPGPCPVPLAPQFADGGARAAEHEVGERLPAGRHDV